MLAHALPHQPGTADLGEGGEHEQQHRPDDRHGRIIARDRPRVRGRPAGPGMIGRCERTPGRPGARAPLRRRDASSAGGRGSPRPACRGPSGPATRPDRSLYTSNASGTTEVYVVGPRDRHCTAASPTGPAAPTPPPSRPTARRCGGSPTPTATSTVTGSPSRSPGAADRPSHALPGVEDGYSAGLDVGPLGRRGGHLDRRRAPGSGCAAATAPPR